MKSHLYDYAKDRCKCPKCKGLGIPWKGYFSCGHCSAIFLIETGEEAEIVEWKNNPHRAIMRKKNG